MINSIHSNYNNPLANLQPKILTNNNAISANNAPNLASSKDISNSQTNKVLGYEVDKDGYFTEEFNKAAGIPNDYKIHSSTMQSLIQANTKGTFQTYKSIDIAKSVGNAYKIVSQLLDKSPELASKDSFSKDDLAHFFPQNYRFNKQSGEVQEVYSYEQVKNIVANGGFKVANNESIAPSFFTMDNGEGSSVKPFDTNILSGGSFEITAKHYSDDSGNITKAGLLVGFLSKNAHTAITPEPLIVGETTIWGKMQGLDETLGSNEINSLSNMLNGALNTSSFGEIVAAMNGTDINEFKTKIFSSKFQPQNEDEKNFIDIIQKAAKKYLELILGDKHITKNHFNINA